MPSRSAQEIAGLVGGRLAGNPDIAVTGVAALAQARSTELSFLGNDKYRGQVLPSQAGVVLVPADFPEPVPAGRAWVHCADPSAAFSKVVMIFAPPPVTFAPGVHPTAVVAPSATVAASASIGPHAVIEPGAVIGERTVIGASTYVGHETRIGDDCLIYPQVVIRERCQLGQRIIIHCGTIIGGDGFGYVPNLTGGLHSKIPQVGIVQIDDDVEIGANATVDRARFGKTWIRRGAKIDNLVQIAHNVEIGELSFVIAQAGVAGSTKVGRGAVLWAQAGVAGHLDIGDGAQVLPQGGVAKDVPPGTKVIGAPGVDPRQFVRDLFNIHRIDKLADTIKALQKDVADLKAQRPA